MSVDVGDIKCDRVVHDVYHLRGLHILRVSGLEDDLEVGRKQRSVGFRGKSLGDDGVLFAVLDVDRDAVDVHSALYRRHVVGLVHVQHRHRNDAVVVHLQGVLGLAPVEPSEVEEGGAVGEIDGGRAGWIHALRLEEKIDAGVDDIRCPIEIESLYGKTSVIGVVAEF